MNDFFKFVDDIKERYRAGLINRTEAMVSIFKSISSLMVNHHLDLSRTIDREQINDVKLNRIRNIVNI